MLIKFIKSEENDAEINTANTVNAIFQKHQEKIAWGKDEKRREKFLRSIYQSTGRMSKL